MSFNIKFNSVDMPTFLRVKAVDYTAFGEPSVNILGKTGGVGGIFGGTTIGAKRIKVKIMVVPRNTSDTIASMTRELGGWLMGNMWKPSELNFSDDPNIFYDAVVDSTVDITDLMFAGEGDITFVVPTGVGRGAIHGKLATIDLVNKTATIVYNGTAPSSAYITYHPHTDVTNWQMTVTETGDRLYINQFTNYGNNIIDCEARRISSTTSTSIKDVQLNYTEWINFPKKGTYHITWNFASTCDLTITCTEYYY